MRTGDHLVQIRGTTTASPDELFAVLADGSAFPMWVAGASQLTSVDDGWPTPGSHLRHSMGIWPLLLGDDISVLMSEPPNRLVLGTHVWPVGETTLEIRIDAWGAGSLVTMIEDVSGGPAKFAPHRLAQALIGLHNRISLRRLVLLAEERAGATHPQSRGASD